jgi:hypothetical protein
LNAARSQQNRFSEPSFDEKGKGDGVLKIDDATVGHIQLVISLIEGRWVDIAEIFAMLDRILRQHSIDSVVKLSYGGLYHQNNPP